MKKTYIAPFTEVAAINCNSQITEEEVVKISAQNQQGDDDEYVDQNAKPFDFSHDWNFDWNHEWEE